DRSNNSNQGNDYSDNSEHYNNSNQGNDYSDNRQSANNSNQGNDYSTNTWRVAISNQELTAEVSGFGIDFSDDERGGQNGSVTTGAVANTGFAGFGGINTSA